MTQAKISWYNWLRHTSWLRFWIMLGISLLFLLLFTKYVMIAFFIVLNVITSFAWKYLHNRYIAIEFITLSTFVTLYSYGFLAALFVLEISVFAYMVITMTFTPNMLLTFPISAILLLFMLPFKPLGIVAVGMMFTIVLNIVLTLIVIMFGTGRLHRRLIFFATHVMFNWFVLKSIAPQLVHTLS
ncbi:hypothetical protein HY488_02105 [Candidatus Woesearchaeota archaeon]|nr:hypothetical protein [Candidatus Woesearchaeota archaeon]